MKKAKIMLMAIAIVGVAGGGLAHNLRHAQQFYTEPVGGGNCIIATLLNYKRTIASSGILIELGTAYDDSNPCPFIYVTIND